MQKLLIRLGNVEAQCESLNTRLMSFENKELVSPEQVKTLIHDEVAELREVEGRRLSLICLNLPESKKDDPVTRQQEDFEFLVNLFETKMNLDVGVMKVSKLVRLGWRVVAETGEIKSRPLRLSVNLFDHKRQILKANALRRECEDDIFGNIYFTPDLTKNREKRRSFLGWKGDLERRRGKLT